MKSDEEVNKEVEEYYKNQISIYEKLKNSSPDNYDTAIINFFKENISINDVALSVFCNEAKKITGIDKPAIKNILKLLRRKEYKEQTPSQPTKTSFLEHDKQIYEQVLGKKFIFLKDGEFKTATQLNFGGEEFLPNEGEEIELGIVLLPSHPEEYGNVAALIQEVKDYIDKWLDVSEQYKTFAAWYVLLTWVHDRVPTINYLRALGDTGTGKSRFLDTIGRLCYKATLGSGGVTVASVKRLVNKWHGSLIIDEGDFKFSDETAELIKFLNLGFEKNRVMFNCDKNDPSKLEYFNPFCAKIISTRRQFQDQALEARCLTEVMQQTTRKDMPPLLTDEFYRKQEELRNKLLKFRFDYYFRIDINKITGLDLGDVEPRIKQACLPFTVLFFNIPEIFNEFKVFIKKYNDSVIEERASSYDGLIVNAIIDLLLDVEVDGEGKPKEVAVITPKNILTELENQNIKGNVRSIGKRLSQLGLKPEVRKVDGVTKRVIPINQRLLEVVKRYCSDFERVTMVTFVTSVTETGGVFSQTAPPHTHTQYKKNIQVNNSNVTNVTDVTEIEEIE